MIENIKAMAINLTKEESIDLRKEGIDLDLIMMGIGWKANKKKENLLVGIFGGKKNVEFDHESIAFLLDENGIVRHIGNEKINGSDGVFFNSISHPSRCVTHSGDERKGVTGVDKDGKIVVRLNALPTKYPAFFFLLEFTRALSKINTSVRLIVPLSDLLMSRAMRWCATRSVPNPHSSGNAPWSWARSIAIAAAGNFAPSAISIPATVSFISSIPKF